MNPEKQTQRREDHPVAKGERKVSTDEAPERGSTGSGDAVLRDAGERVGTHSLGTATGAVGGAAAGAVSGLAAGPIGALAGAVGGAVLGGSAAAATGGTGGYDTSAEEAFLRKSIAARADLAAGMELADYEPAYRYGLERYLETDHPQRWDEVEEDLAGGWEAARGRSRLTWDDARSAVREAWMRMYDGTALINRRGD